MLQEAGFSVTAREVHAEIMRKVREGTPSEKLSMAVEAIDWLLMILMDGAPEPDEEASASGNVEAPAS